MSEPWREFVDEVRGRKKQLLRLSGAHKQTVEATINIIIRSFMPKEALDDTNDWWYRRSLGGGMEAALVAENETLLELTNFGEKSLAIWNSLPERRKFRKKPPYRPRCESCGQLLRDKTA